MEPKATILIADDEPNIRLLLSDELRDAGYRVLTAENGAQAIGIAEDERPDLIILDVRMPEMNGIEAVRWLKVVSATTPVIICSAFAGLTDLFTEVRSGITAFLPKPMNLSLLRETVENVLRMRPCTTY